jgi:predicted dehydrogenase
MNSRRRFIGTVTSAGVAAIAAPGTVLGASERVRIGVIGLGDRGIQLAREAVACQNVEIVAAAEVYARRLEAIRQIAPAARAVRDARELLSEKALDAVIIATPQHLHCEHFLAAVDARKHVFVEKTMALDLSQAKRMRTALHHAGKLTVQVGHQACSSGHVADAANFLQEDKVGRITAIRMHMYRNTPVGKPHWSRPVFPDMTPENVDWARFLGEAPIRPFDSDRFQNWRYFADYSGGNVHESMSQQLAFWYKVLDLGIPQSVSMTGGVFLWRDGREVPDTMHVTAVQSEGILISWDSGLGNNAPGTGEEVLGTHGTISRSQLIRYAPQKINRPHGVEIAGQARTAPASHMRNFIDSIRGLASPTCPFEIGYRVSVACAMALESYRTGRTVFWDRDREEIV